MSWELGRICCNEGREWALTTHQWATLTYLAMMAVMGTNCCTVTMRRIAEATKQTDRSARAKVQELERLGYLKIIEARGNRHANTYQLHVDKLAEIGTPRQISRPEDAKPNRNVATPAKPQIGTPRQIKSEHGDRLNRNVAADLGGTIGGVQGLKAERVSKLVGMAPHRKQVVNDVGNNVDKSGQNNSAEELPIKHKKSVLEIAPSARYDVKKVFRSIADRRSDEEYQALMREPGWKPQTRADRLACNMRCYAFGASREQAAKFVSYNAVHRWAACDMASINDLAHMWVASWRRESPDEWRAEQARRKYEESTRTLD